METQKTSAAVILAAMLMLLSPAALGYGAAAGGPDGTAEGGNARAGGSSPGAPAIDTFDTPAGAVRCESVLGLPPTPPAFAAAAPAPGGAGALQMVNCFSHGMNCDAPCGDGLDIVWDVVQCKYDDDYDGVWDRYGPIEQVNTGWCCPPIGGGGWGWW